MSIIIVAITRCILLLQLLVDIIVGNIASLAVLEYFSLHLQNRFLCRKYFNAFEVFNTEKKF